MESEQTTTDEELLTKALFARVVSYMAKECAGWAGDCLILAESVGEPMRRDALRRFTTDMRDRLEYLESRHVEE